MIKSIKRFAGIPIPDHVNWLCRPRVLTTGATYHMVVRRWAWSVIDYCAKGDSTRFERLWGHVLAKVLNVMWRMERLTGGESVGT